MKKTLLCFVFLFSTIFYAQVSDITMCFGEIDLNMQKIPLIGNLNPAETTVSYYLSLADATNNANAITNPSNYHPVSTTTIYARIDNNGTISTNSFKITVIPALNITDSMTPIICKGNTSTIAVTASGGSGQYSYSINGSAYTLSNIFTNLSAGVHTVTILDTATGCSTRMSYNIIEPALLNTTAAINGQTATITAIGGIAPYQYSLDGTNYQASNVFPSLAAGSKTFITKDSQGCSATVMATILPVLTCTASITKPLDCISNASIAATATGGQPPYTYSKNGEAFQSNNVFTNLTAGNYTIIAKDASNTTTIPYTISIVPLTNLTAIATVSKAVNCGESDTVTITASGGKAPFVYSLDQSNNYSSANTFTGLTAGPHIFHVKDANNCLATSTVTIEPSASLSLLFTTIWPRCYKSNDGVIVLNVSGGKAPYTYSIGNGYVTNNTFNLLSAGNYNLSVKDALGCISTTIATIEDPTPILMTAITANSTTIDDNDGSIDIIAMGGVSPYSYALTENGGSLTTPFQNSPLFTGLKAGSYDMTVKDANGCSILQTISIDNKSNSLTASVATTSITCLAPGIITVNAAGGTVPYQYSFDNGINYVSANTFTCLTPGTYSVKVHDAENNTITIPAEIIQANSLAIAATLISNVNCKGDNTGSIEVNTTGGAFPYMYSLDNGPYIISVGNSMIFNNLYADTHQITVKDANGCLATTQVVVLEPVLALTTQAIIKNQTITINVSGGSGTYKYAISPDLDKVIMNNVFSELNPDSYTILISDENGCYNTINVLVDPSAPTIDGQINLTLPFKPGQTLANLIVNGKNIKWYSSQHPLTGKTKKTAETPLPLTTVLVDGTTYYASQTINEIESTERLAVTVKSGSLGTDEFVIKDFTYYPNPVKNVLTISNTSVIDEVILASIKGETLLTKQINSLSSEIDLSHFSNGIYLLKIKSEGTEKTVKLIKE